MNMRRFDDDHDDDNDALGIGDGEVGGGSRLTGSATAAYDNIIMVQDYTTTVGLCRVVVFPGNVNCDVTPILLF